MSRSRTFETLEEQILLLEERYLDGKTSDADFKADLKSLTNFGDEVIVLAHSTLFSIRKHGH